MKGRDWQGWGNGLEVEAGRVPGTAFLLTAGEGTPLLDKTYPMVLWAVLGSLENKTL